MIKVIGKNGLILLGGLMMVGLCVYAGWGISSALRRYADNLIRRRDNASFTYLSRAEHHDSIGESDLAFWNLQMAVANAIDIKQKGMAALAMAEFLLGRAQDKEPMPYAMMARQYSEAVLDISADRDFRYRACRIMVEVALLINDADIMEMYLQEGINTAPTRDDAAMFVIRKIGVLVNTRKAAELKSALDMVKDYYDVSGVKEQVVFLNARLIHELAEDVDFAKRWFGVDDSVLRQADYEELSRSVETALQSIMEEATFKDFSEAIFNLASLKMLQKDYAAAQPLFEDFLMTESSQHQSEVLMYMAIIARNEGRVMRAERLLDIFIKRFSWNKVAAEEFMAVVKEMVDRNRSADALSFMDKYLSAGLSGGFEVQMLHFAARTALDAGLSEIAESYYKQLYNLRPDDDLMIESLLMRGRIAKEGADYKKAMALLFEYLVTFPYEAKRGDTYFEVFEIQRLANGYSPSALITIASAAALEKPDDPRTKTVLLAMAEMLENMELYDMARDRYGRIALLHYISGMQSSISVSESSMVYEAMLGAGRCYYKMGDYSRSDSVFRDLCNSLPPSSVRSEAAYYWAQIAVINDQLPEARRRLSLIAEDTLGSELKAQSRVEAALISVHEQGFQLGILDRLVEVIAGLDVADQSRLWAKFVDGAMLEIDRTGDVQGMYELFQWASDKKRSAMFPLRRMHAQTAGLLLIKRGVDEYGQFLRSTKELLSEDGDYTNEVNIFMGLLDNIDELKLSRDAVL